MTRCTRAWAGATIALALTLLVGCSADGSEQSTSTDMLRQESITLDDGRTVQCVVYATINAGGLSCDWASAGDR